MPAGRLRAGVSGPDPIFPMNFIRYFLLSSALAAGSNLHAATAEAPQWRFTFGPGGGGGAVAVKPADSYNVNRGYGFDLGSTVTFTEEGDTNAGTSGATRGGFVTGAEGLPFFFSVKLDPGTYRARVTLGDAKAETVATVKSETRRLMTGNLRVPAGQTETVEFLVHVRVPRLPDGSSVRMKPREIEPILYVQWKPAEKSPLIPFVELDWDEKLTLEFSGPHAAVRAIALAPANDVPKLFLIGDSTMTDQMMEPVAAWGQMLPRWFKPGVVIANYAECGETASGFIAERRWAKLLTELRAGDTVLIDFGINDRRMPVAEYKQNLAQLVKDTVAHRATPVLVTPQNLRSGFFDASGHGQPTLGEYPVAMRQLAAETGTTLIDLNTISVTLYEAIGQKNLPAAFFDGTHHNNYGAYELARCVTRALLESKLPVAQFISDDARSFDPAHPDALADFHLPPDPQLDPARPGGPGAPDGRGPMAGAVETKPKAAK